MKIIILFFLLSSIAIGSWVGGTGGAGQDATAIHRDRDNEINTITEKNIPDLNDILLIEDSADTWKKKRLPISSIPGLITETDPLSLHLDGSNAMTGNILAAGGGLYSIGSSAAGFEKIFLGNTSYNLKFGWDTDKFVIDMPKVTSGQAYDLVFNGGVTESTLGERGGNLEFNVGYSYLGNGRGGDVIFNFDGRDFSYFYLYNKTHNFYPLYIDIAYRRTYFGQPGGNTISISGSDLFVGNGKPMILYPTSFIFNVPIYAYNNPSIGHPNHTYTLNNIFITGGFYAGTSDNDRIEITNNKINIANTLLNGNGRSLTIQAGNAEGSDTNNYDGGSVILKAGLRANNGNYGNIDLNVDDKTFRVRKVDNKAEFMGIPDDQHEVHIGTYGDGTNWAHTIFRTGYMYKFRNYDNTKDLIVIDELGASEGVLFTTHYWGAGSEFVHPGFRFRTQQFWLQGNVGDETGRIALMQYPTNTRPTAHFVGFSIIAGHTNTAVVGNIGFNPDETLDADFRWGRFIEIHAKDILGVGAAYDFVEDGLIRLASSGGGASTANHIELRGDSSMNLLFTTKNNDDRLKLTPSNIEFFKDVLFKSQSNSVIKKADVTTINPPNLVIEGSSSDTYTASDAGGHIIFKTGYINYNVTNGWIAPSIYFYADRGGGNPPMVTARISQDRSRGGALYLYNVYGSEASISYFHDGYMHFYTGNTKVMTLSGNGLFIYNAGITTYNDDYAAIGQLNASYRRRFTIGAFSQYLTVGGVGATSNEYLYNRIELRNQKLKQIDVSSTVNSGNGLSLTIEGSNAATGTNGNGGDLILQAGAKDGTGTDGKLILKAGSVEIKNIGGDISFTADSNQNVTLGKGGLSSTATDGFPYIPTCSDTPTGTPATKTGFVPMCYDITNNKLCVYNSVWKCITLN